MLFKLLLDFKKDSRFVISKYNLKILIAQWNDMCK